MTQNFTPSVVSQSVAHNKANTMKLVYVSLLLMCIVIKIKSERTRSGVCQGCRHEQYVRIKRAKYYSNPPLRFYNIPPMSYPVRGAFSLTPPPGYQMDDVRQPQNSRPKVSSSRPTNEGLGDEDISNIMRFLSKQDLDKIVEFANEKQRELPKRTESFYERPNYVFNQREKHESKVMFADNDLIVNAGKKIPSHENFINIQQGFRPYSIEYNDNNINELKETKPFRTSELGSWTLSANKRQTQFNTQLDPYEFQERNENRNAGYIFSDSRIMQEEQLPKPSNLREDDFEVSFTNNVPTVVKANSNSYKIENFGSLPLMNYHSKMESVDSYKVPHYTVTSPGGQRAASKENIPVEPAPPVSTAREQSDAHLKATKIWTHKSKGTAYTLHNDGTLSLEKLT